MIGRILRPTTGNTEAIILDHSGAVFRRGLPEDRADWFLGPDLSSGSLDHEAREPEVFGGPTMMTPELRSACDSMPKGVLTRITTACGKHGRHAVPAMTSRNGQPWPDCRRAAGCTDSRKRA
jgi:hypothetical protein